MGVLRPLSAIPLKGVMGARLHICMTCKAGLAVPEGEKPMGALLWEAVAALQVM
jgi:hypothetical protein